MNPNSPCCRPLLAKYPSKSLSSLPTPIPANPPLSLQLPLRPHKPSLSSVNPPGPTNTSGDSARNRAGEKDKAGTAPSTQGCGQGWGQCRGQPSPCWLDRAAAASYRAALTPGGRRPGQQGSGPAAKTVPVLVPVPISTPILILRPHRLLTMSGVEVSF